MQIFLKGLALEGKGIVLCGCVVRSAVVVGGNHGGLVGVSVLEAQ